MQLSRWSARYNGTRLTEYSANETVFFSFDYRETTTLLEVQDTGPGSVRLIGKPGKGLNESVAQMQHWADSCDFSAYQLGPPVQGALNFQPSFGLHQGGEQLKVWKKEQAEGARKVKLLMTGASPRAACPCPWSPRARVLH